MQRCKLPMAAAGAAVDGTGALDTTEFGETVAEQTSKEVFAVYQCRSAAAAHGHAHPGDIAEPSSLSGEVHGAQKAQICVKCCCAYGVSQPA
jgi:hypothetical protein